MATLMLMDLGRDFDPVAYLEKRRTGFLHSLRGYVHGIRAAKESQDPCSGIGDCAGDMINNYLIFGNMMRHVRGSEACKVLSRIVKTLEFAVDAIRDEDELRASLTSGSKELTVSFDNMVADYDLLLDALRNRR